MSKGNGETAVPTDEELTHRAEPPPKHLAAVKRIVAESSVAAILEIVLESAVIPNCGLDLAPNTSEQETWRALGRRIEDAVAFAHQKRL